MDELESELNDVKKEWDDVVRSFEEMRKKMCTAEAHHQWKIEDMVKIHTDELRTLSELNQQLKLELSKYQMSPYSTSRKVK